MSFCSIKLIPKRIVDQSFTRTDEADQLMTIAEQIRSHLNGNSRGGMEDREYVFIVGAGFSRYAGLPLTSEFTEKLLEVTELKPSGPSAYLVPFLRKFVEDVFAHKSSAAAEFWPHLEDIFKSVDLSAN